MRERLLHFLTIERISPAHFADLIGVQRSSVSHILSGRNNPGLEFIQKILNAYPKINAEWLIMGKGEMLKVAKQGTIFGVESFKEEDTVSRIETSEMKKSLSAIPSLNDSKEIESEEKFKTNLTSPLIENKLINNEINKRRILEKVLFIYSDLSFEIFYPAQNS